MTYVWLITGVSDSTDHYAKVVGKKPTDAQLSRLAHLWDGSETKDGDGFDGSYVYITLTSMPVESLK